MNPSGAAVVGCPESILELSQVVEHPRIFGRDLEPTWLTDIYSSSRVLMLLYRCSNITYMHT
eukprot:906007-Amorphochlora_amoeboformis.AAC.1